MALALFPLSLLFAALVFVRRAAYRHGLLRSERIAVPLVVVGNITVGGAGKTPLVIALARGLRALGKRPGIVSRGYRGGGGGTAIVTAASDPSMTGDEPVLLARRSGCPVVVGQDRVAAAKTLLAAFPEVDLILCDDGLQHYRLARDIEIAVFDRRGVMNGWPLPAGPLREPVTRLRDVHAMVLNGCTAPPDAALNAASLEPTFCAARFTMQLHATTLFNLGDPALIRDPAAFSGMKLHAVAGIGDPARFFEQLTTLGLDFSAHPFTDHHSYGAGELAFTGDAIVTTEKDAVKLAALTLALPVWVLPVTAELKPDLAAFVLEKLNGRPPA